MTNKRSTPYRRIKNTVEAGTPSVAVTRTATADGTGTAVIAATDQLVNVSASNVAHWVTLPDPATCEDGKVFKLSVGATGCELRSNDPATIAINGVTGAGVELAMTANIMVEVEKISDTAWAATPASGTPDA